MDEISHPMRFGEDDYWICPSWRDVPDETPST